MLAVEREDEDGPRWAVMSTALGRARLRVHPRCASPALGAQSIELDVDERLELGGNAQRTDERSPRWTQHDDAIEWIGSVEEVEDEGLVYLRLAPDCLVTIEAAPDAFVAGEWLHLALRARSVTVCAFGV
ncbi:hypothetical protein DB32_004001 [Sandaracinus amylolyticus]|uniref:Transport-associated OB type 2 domain-containing protein n=1 Tax=Sandaracinus amylolyticus TaxID=927083 RepID=A0A0F6W471_9BACT|nr:hypothetical protein DB32_004001 [Sandaracinus amylolyticus]